MACCFPANDAQIGLFTNKKENKEKLRAVLNKNDQRNGDACRESEKDLTFLNHYVSSRPERNMGYNAVLVYILRGYIKCSTR